MTSSKVPTPDEVTKAVALLIHPEHQRLFFDRLENPNWVTPLREKGVFNAPPPAVRDETRGTVGFPPWPQSRYLARMAAVAPEIVLETILRVPDTDNVRVLENFVDAALAMPAQLAARIVPAAKDWVKKPYLILLPRKLGDLVEHLARGGQTKVAIGLAQSLLAVVPDPRPPIPIDEAKGVFFSPEPRARFGLWEYGEILKKNVPTLVEHAKDAAHAMLCDLLQDALRLSRNSSEQQTPDDLSHAWRPAIEDHGQNLDKDVRELLVRGVRDASELLATRDARSVPTLVHSLRRRRSRIFLRLAHHLLSTHPDAAPQLVERTLSSRALFNNARLWHEYALLLKSCFKRLSPNHQARVLNWVETGPDVERYRNWHDKFFGKPATESEVTQHTLAWQRDHLALISEDLPEAWKSRYSLLIEKFGPPQFPEFASYTSGGAFGYRSPTAEKHLAALGMDELVRFLKSWEPQGDWMDESPEGLGRQLTSLVSSEPERFANAASQFVNLDPTYVRAVLDGLNEAAKKNVHFSWPSVLALCAWVSNQERELIGRKVGFRERDPDWGWTRTAIARLMSTGLESEPSLIPPELRQSIWDVLRSLTDDPEPTPDYEARYEGSNMDLLTLSMNTTRGEAMHAVVRYALWVRRHVEKQADGQARIARGFDEMPEVRQMLDYHLEPNNDASLAIRAVYGRWMPWLVLLDKNWVRESVGKIFPPDGALRKLRDACWDAYIVTSNPYDNVLDVLHEEYRIAIERVGTGRPSHLGDPSERLAEHLMAFYWRGRLSLHDSGGLLPRFYSKASDQLCGRALIFVGMSLRNTKETIPKTVLERLQALWLSRLEGARSSSSPSSHSLEMAAFGWWYASAKFDDVWSLEQLIEALKIAGKVDIDHLVIERLLGLAEKMPGPVVDCLTLMVEGDKEGWAVLGWHAQAHTILGTVLKNPDPRVKERAIALVNRLGRLGHLDFADLIDLGPAT